MNTLKGILIVPFVAAGLCAWAQYAINWHTIDGGGGTSTGGVYAVSGTIGQPDANTTPMTGGPYSLTGGFWAFIAIQTPGAPYLAITPSTPGFAHIAWNPESPGWVLQQTDSLTPPAWTNAPSGSTNEVDVLTTPQTRFYRLVKPY